LARLVPPDPPLTDGVVALRAMTLDDVPAITRACQDPEIPRWTLVPSPYTEADARSFVCGLDAVHAAGRALSLAVVEAPSGPLLGVAGLAVVDAERRRAEVGYWVAAWARGRGVAARALRLVSAHAFAVLGLEVLHALVDRENGASQAVARAAGFAPAPAPQPPYRPETAGPRTLAFARTAQGGPQGYPPAA
jgi:RimJ/RimL family protein N-acetyltransferase